MCMQQMFTANSVPFRLRSQITILVCLQCALTLTLTIASATAERSFPVGLMRRIKSHLRSSMSDTRRSSLALIAVERESSQKLMKDPAAEIDIFATMGGNKRRLDLLL